MADGVDAVVDAAQPPVGTPPLDPVAIDARGNQLLVSDPPVLATCDFGDRVERSADIAPKATRPPDSPQDCGQGTA
jgi:hypothetical protein